MLTMLARLMLEYGRYSSRIALKMLFQQFGEAGPSQRMDSVRLPKSGACEVTACWIPPLEHRSNERACPVMEPCLSHVNTEISAVNQLKGTSSLVPPKQRRCGSLSLLKSDSLSEADPVARPLSRLLKQANCFLCGAQNRAEATSQAAEATAEAQGRREPKGRVANGAGKDEMSPSVAVTWSLHLACSRTQDARDFEARGSNLMTLLAFMAHAAMPHPVAEVKRLSRSRDLMRAQMRGGGKGGSAVFSVVQSEATCISRISGARAVMTGVLEAARGGVTLIAVGLVL